MFSSLGFTDVLIPNDAELATGSVQATHIYAGYVSNERKNASAPSPIKSRISKTVCYNGHPAAKRLFKLYNFSPTAKPYLTALIVSLEY